jgi:hypothetical protein
LVESKNIFINRTIIITPKTNRVRESRVLALLPFIEEMGVPNFTSYQLTFSIKATDKQTIYNFLVLI